MDNERNYGIDLLRIILMFMVCILHILGRGGILEAVNAESIDYKVYMFLEIISYSAVDGFAIISGYMAVNKPQKYEKIINMWFQAFFYSFVITVIFTIIGINDNLSKSELLLCALPIFDNKFWYFSAYFILFLSMPILNRFLFETDDKTSKKALIILIVLFTFINLFADPFIVNDGYSPLWLIVLYCLGGLAKRNKLFENRKTYILILLFFLSCLITWADDIFGEKILVNYVSPTIFLNGIIMVIIFSRIHVKKSLNISIINKLSPLVFGIYLFQLNQVVWEKLLNDTFIFISEQNIVIGVLYVFAFAFVLFISGMFIELIRTKTAQLLRIPLLSKKIVIFLDKALEKINIS